MQIKKSLIRRTSILTLAIWLCCESAFAQLGTPGLTASLDNMKKTQQVWDLIWTELFTPSAVGQSTIYLSLMIVARFIAGLGTILVLVRVVEMLSSNGDWRQIVKPMMVITLMWFLLYGGDGMRPIHFSEGMRNIIHGWRNGALSLNMADVQVSDALKDQLIMEHAKDELSEQVNYCDQLPAKMVSLPAPTRPTGDDVVLSPDQKALYEKLECYQAVGNLAQKKKEEYESRWCPFGPLTGGCAATLRWLSNFSVALLDGTEREMRKVVSGEFPNVIGGPLAMADVTVTSFALHQMRFWLVGIQNLFVHSIEAIMYLTVLTTPIAIAMMSIPLGRMNALVSWLVIFVNLGLAQVYYVVLVGGMAIAITKAELPYMQDVLLPLIQALGAPIIAAGMAVGGGIGGFMAISKATTGFVGAIPIVGAGAAALFPRFQK